MSLSELEILAFTWDKLRSQILPSDADIAGDRRISTGLTQITFEIRIRSEVKAPGH